MSTSAASRIVPTTTLAEVIERVTAREDLPLRRRHDLTSAVRVMARLLGLPPADIAADPEALRYRLRPMTAASTGVSPRRWRNLKSLFNMALTVTGVTSTGQRSRDVISADWLELLNRISDRYERARLSKLARYCSLRSITPSGITEAVVDAFGMMLLRESIVDRPKQVHRDACLTWNRLVDRINGWPAIHLRVPNNRRAYALPLLTFAPSFAADVEAYLDHLAGHDLFSETARAPASPVTIRNRRVQLSQLATALVRSGRQPASIRSLADLVDVSAAKQAINFFWQRNGKRKTGQIHNFALLLVNLAKHWTDVPPAQLEALRSLRRQVDPGKSGMTDRNRARLRAFDDPVNVERLVNLPDRIIRCIGRSRGPSYNAAIHVQSALAIALELVAPLRAKNLAALTLDRHFVRSRPGLSAVVHLVIPAGEVKNKNPLEFELPPDVVRLLDLYVERFRPPLMTDNSAFLFPARQGGAKTPAQIAEQIQRAIRIGTGLAHNLHLFRHLAAFLYLKAHPGDYETVRLLLGHKDLATTVRSYCGFERSDAIRRYDKLIDSYRQHDEQPHAD